MSRLRGWIEVVREMVAAASLAGTLSAEELTRLRVDDLLQAIAAYLDTKSTFDRLRRSRFPWILQPRAWRARVARGRAETRLQAIKTLALSAIAAGSSVSAKQPT